MKKITIIILFIALTSILVSCDMVKLKVQFKSEGELIKEEQYALGKTIVEPSDVTKDGYDLEGWYRDLADDSTKWDFTNGKITTHLILHAMWIKNENYVEVENIKLNNNLITWDEIEGAKYQITFLENVIDLEINEFSFVNYLDSLKLNDKTNFILKPIKANFESIETKFELLYNSNEEKTIINQDFETMTKGSYKIDIKNESGIDYILDETLVTKTVNDSKNDLASAKLRENGILTIDYVIEDFNSLSFYFGKNKNSNHSSFDIEYQVINTEEWIKLVTLTTTDTFDQYLLTNELVSKEGIKIRFKKDSTTNFLNIDDIVVTTMSLEGFELRFEAVSEYGNYYDSIDGLTGIELVNELNFILTTNLKSVSYADIKTVLGFADIDPDNPNKVIGIYNRELYEPAWAGSGNWHREHVWPNSKLGMERVKENDVNQGSDPHNLRAIHPSTNSSRSNRYYVNNTNPINTLGHTEGTESYYPGDLDIGDVSRILMYMAVRYKSIDLILTDSKTLLNKGTYTADTAYMGLLSNLEKWHNLDPVDRFEINRNEVIYQNQGNRNPFIDKPEIFNEVFTYFMNEDSNRLINMDLTIDYSLNYSEFINKKYLYI